MSTSPENRHIKIPGPSLAASNLSESAAPQLFTGDCMREHVTPLRASVAGATDTVLVLLADAGERRQLTEALAALGCKSLVAVDGKAALEIAKLSQPDLIVLDINMPVLDGFQVCAELRNDELLSHIPVILLAHRFDAADKMRGLRLGAVDYITEPFDWAEVAAQTSSQLTLERLRRNLKVANFGLMAKQAQHQADLKAAADIQKSLLPRNPTENFKDVSVSWKFLPLDQVGGDLLGYKWLDADHLAAYVVDVCGHGMPAAMMTAAISTSLAPSAMSGDGAMPAKLLTAFSPKEVLETLDCEYPLERFDRPFTISYLALDRRTGEFRCSRAGHPMPIIIRSNGLLESIEAGGTIIGLGRMVPFDDTVGKLNPGDSILLYSDGVTECVGESGPFGLEGLMNILRQCSGGSPESICDKIMMELVRFNGGTAMHDDVTMLALTYYGSPARGEATIGLSGQDGDHLAGSGN
jgi:phosphoserine phosphatase RsbU/P